MKIFSSSLVVLGLLELVHCTPAYGTQGEKVTNVITYVPAVHREGFVINGFVGKTGVYCQTCKHFVVAEGCKLPKETGPGVEITCDQMWSKSGGDKVCKTTGDDDYTCDGKKDGQKPTVCYGCDQTQ
ncbi:hypothetical protein MJO29_004015 [Puccinia striiformis f. sp. tritici]|uniref:uncharacterized protein n=1 Tax=Puccinia striiformis f. sp. tritici TaxID=168172 RepID=UPI002008D248|nr:uncharacterized protein Pst134EA_032176 [Puccinia striiformis f. sp. tritici]KAH9441841.1 hypothetical protein Pst134EA_032176 [Puccinia striiformis f. sp. tritici]KAI7963588.1 hypothetical protein MJO29_004015 [Puccinia striiformis f. sp. tritici]KAI9617102.1 hypothetical protein KEM48_004959 [Puccinia striiformis f. sp. tritici PST-130]